MVALYARTAIGSRFVDWSTAPPPYVCGRPNGPPFPPGASECDIFLDDSTGEAASVQAMFTLASPCIAPGLKGKTLAKAKLFIKRSGCSLGKITHAFSNTVKKGRVLSQNPRAGWQREHGAKINLNVSKGRR
jgi:serine/threonine-protein kinase